MKTLSKIGLRIRYLPSMLWHIYHIFIRHKLSSSHCKICARLTICKVFIPENDAIKDYIACEKDIKHYFELEKHVSSK